MEPMPPMTAEAIANAEKKMNMTLDDIIKISKKSSCKSMRSSASKRSRRAMNSGVFQAKSSKVQRFMDSRVSLRQDVLSQRRSDFKEKCQFPLAKKVARSAAIAPICDMAPSRNKGMNWNKPRLAHPTSQMKVAHSGFVAKVTSELKPNQTLDALFGNMKEQRRRLIAEQKMLEPRSALHQRARQRSQGRVGGRIVAAAAPFRK